MPPKDPTTKLEQAAKVFGSIKTIVLVVLGAAFWIFTVQGNAQAAREEVKTVKAELVEMKQAADIRTEKMLLRMDEMFREMMNTRLALEGIRGELTGRGIIKSKDK